MPPTTDIHDIKGLVPVPGVLWWLWALIGLTVLVGGVLLYRWWQRRNAGVDVPAPPPPSPYERARRALQDLKADQLMERGEVDPFYTRLSDIVRRYLEDQFRLRAPERTTEEFLQDVSRSGGLSEHHRELLGAFLQECDLVKFARHRPALADMERAFEAAETFVNESRPEPLVAGVEISP